MRFIIFNNKKYIITSVVSMFFYIFNLVCHFLEFQSL